MGSCCSIQDSDDEHEPQRHVNERPRPIVFNMAVIAYGERRSDYVPHRGHHTHEPPQPLYGEYNCEYCGRCWSSTLSWQKTYQACKQCQRNVYPKNQRALRESDIKRDGNVAEHSKELCQKCQQLGYYCGRRNKSGPTSGKNCYNKSAVGTRSYNKRGNRGRVQVRSRTRY